MYEGEKCHEVLSVRGKSNEQQRKNDPRSENVPKSLCKCMLSNGDE